MTSKNLTVFIINWDCIDITKKCIDRIQKYTDLSKISICVIDNGSSDPQNIKDLKNLKNLGSIDRILASSKNLGFSLAFNIGMKEFGKHLTCFLSNDCYVEHNWLEEALITFKSDPDIGALCSNVYQDNFNDEIKEDVYIDQLYGAIMFIAKDAWEDVGCLDYLNFSPAYSEELDWSYRARKKGYKLCCSAKSRAYHIEHATMDKKYNRYEIHIIKLTHRIKCRLMNFTIIKMMKFWKQYIKEIVEEYKNHTLHIYLIAIRNNFQMLPYILSERKKRFRLEKIDFNFQYKIVQNDGVENIISP